MTSMYGIFMFFLEDSENQVTPFLGSKLDLDLQANVNRCKIPKDRLRLEKQLNKGHFGVVYKATLITSTGNLRTVAVKSFKGKQAHSNFTFQWFYCMATKPSK